MFQNSVSSFIVLTFVMMFITKEDVNAYTVNISKNMFCQEPFCCSMWETTIYCRTCVICDKYIHTNILWHMHISKWILEGKPYRFLMDVILFCIFYSVLVFCYEIIFIVFSSQTFEYFSIIYIL